MTQHFPISSPVAVDHASTLIHAMRRWRYARNAGQPTQPSLSEGLSLQECEMLAPALDSLFRFYEHALDRPIAIGTIEVSADEHLLLDLLEGSSCAPCLDCPHSAQAALECALCSTRIMLSLAIQAVESISLPDTAAP